MLTAATGFLDVLWPIFVATGLERVRIDPGNTAFTPLDFEHYPISHSLAMVLVWAMLFAGLYWRVSRYRRGAIVAGILVASHWFLDVIVHRPDLPIAPGWGVKVGLGLWNSVAGTVIVEGLLFAAGVWIYARATRARDRRGRYGFWAFVAFLALIFAANASGPPPPSVRAVVIAGLAGGLAIIAWSAWFDHHRLAA
ncbi:MAG: metal-dependent hydrolase [Bryobacteraceae bacterium]